MKRRVRVWNKVKLLECSVVGIPAYPDAHYSQDEFSLIKSISSAFVGETEEIPELELNLNTETNMEVEKSTETLEKSEKVEVKTLDMSEVIAKAIVEGLKDGFDKLATERGLEQTAKPNRVKSIGELAVESGLFVLPGR